MKLSHMKRRFFSMQSNNLSMQNQARGHDVLQLAFCFGSGQRMNEANKKGRRYGVKKRDPSPSFFHPVPSLLLFQTLPFTSLYNHVWSASSLSSLSVPACRRFLSNFLALEFFSISQLSNFLLGTEELAVTYAALILHDAGQPVTAAAIAAVVKAANVTVQPFWPSLFERVLKTKKIDDLIMSAGSGSFSPL